MRGSSALAIHACMGVSPVVALPRVSHSGGGALVAVSLMVYRHIKTYRKVRRYLQREVDTLNDKIYTMKEQVAERLGAGGKEGPVQESLPNASELKQMLEDDHEVHLVGGRAESAEEFLRQMKQADHLKRHAHGSRVPKLSTFLKTLCLWIALSIGALVLWLRDAELLPGAMMDALPEAYATNYRVGAIILSVLSLLILFYECLTLFPTGQDILHWLFDALKAAYVGVLMTLVLILYIPISRQALSVFICDEHVCSADEWFPVQSPGADANLASYIQSFTKDYTDIVAAISSSNGTAYEALGPPSSCQECAWLSGPGAGNTCPSALSEQLCPTSTTFRLTAAPQIDCTQQWPFYMPGSLLTLVMFTFGVPYMFYQLTNRHTAMYGSLPIYEEMPKSPTKAAAQHGHLSSLFHRRNDGGWKGSPWELDDQWMRRVRKADKNRAKSLYADFEFEWRYWKLLMLGMKFFIIVIDILKTKFTSVLAAPVLMLLVHASMLMLSVFARPYTDKRPDLLSMSISFANVFNWALLLIMAMRVAAPAFMIYVILAVNLLLPIVAITGGWALNHRKLKHLQLSLAMSPNRRTYKDMREVAQKRRGVERHINDFTLRFISKWTWGVLLCAVIGGELIFIGTFAEAALSPVTGHTAGSTTSPNVVDCYREEYARSQELIGFDTWAAFTDNCCCMSRSNVSSLAHLETHPIELWSCFNRDNVDRPRVYKERQRRDLTFGETVAPVRRFCGQQFLNSDGTPAQLQEPVWNEAIGKLGVWTYFANGTRERFWDDYW